MMSGNLAGSMGCVGQPDHPEVIKTVTGCNSQTGNQHLMTTLRALVLVFWDGRNRVVPWDGTNRVYFNRAGFAILDDSGIALEMPELCVFPATERRSFRPYTRSGPTRDTSPAPYWSKSLR